MKAIIAGYCFRSENKVHRKNSMRYLLKMLIDENGGPRKDMQSIASRIILDKLENGGNDVAEKHPETFSELIYLLSYCSMENSSVTS